MKNRICEMLGIDVPILGFSHCRDVVVEVSRAGGFGVLGMARINPARLKEELLWIDDHIDGRPYGIDVLMPKNFESAANRKYMLEAILPATQVEFVRDMLDRAGIARLPASDEAALMRNVVEAQNYTPEESLRMLDVAMEHPIKLLVSGLGTPPEQVVRRAHQAGIKVTALAGKVQHAMKHKAAGCDFVIAVGTEAGGHTGSIGSIVLWPDIVDAVAPLPVIGGGGVGRGNQVAAALALGCEGVWCGSIWLKTVESEVTPDVKARIFAAEATDAILTKVYSGKQCRVMRSDYTEAWAKPGAPDPLPPPLQTFLSSAHAHTRIERARAKAFLTFPVGQIVGHMKEEATVRQVFREMLEELAGAKDRFDQLFE